MTYDFRQEYEKTQKLLHPENYMFSHQYGALFEDESVEDELPWLERAGRQLPIVFGTTLLYSYLQTLPEAEASVLERLSKRQLHRVAKRYSFLVSAYLKNHKHGKPLRPNLNVIPRNMARPFVYVCQKLGIPPILAYDHYCQGNWRLTDPRGPFEVENLALEQVFVDPKNVPDESGFVLVHTVIEQRGKTTPYSIGKCKLAMQRKNHPLVEACLWAVSGSIQQMCAELLKMPFWCDPDVYHLEVRPQIQLFTNVIYEGVEDPEFQKPVTKRGETGAQSTLLELLKRFMDIPETITPLIHHTREMRKYMLPEQVAFIKLVEETASVREYIKKYWRQHPGLLKAYNACVENLFNFLRVHLKYTVMYLERKGEGDTGTGGTPFKKFLSLHLWEIRKGRLYRHLLEKWLDRIRIRYEKKSDPLFV